MWPYQGSMKPSKSVPYLGLRWSRAFFGIIPTNIHRGVSTKPSRSLADDTFAYQSLLRARPRFAPRPPRGAETVEIGPVLECEMIPCGFLHHTYQYTSWDVY